MPRVLGDVFYPVTYFNFDFVPVGTCQFYFILSRSFWSLSTRMRYMFSCDLSTSLHIDTHIHKCTHTYFQFSKQKQTKKTSLFLNCKKQKGYIYVFSYQSAVTMIQFSCFSFWFEAHRYPLSSQNEHLTSLFLFGDFGQANDSGYLW